MEIDSAPPAASPVPESAPVPVVADQPAPPATEAPSAAEPESAAKSDGPSESQPAPDATDADTTMGGTVDAPADAPANTPSSSKKTTNGKRKSTGGVPEHKNKKLNKKKSMPKMTHLDAAPGEHYFARLKSYPPWPAVICDEGMLPPSLLTSRPVSTKNVDGSYRPDFDEGGKRAHERTFPIMFLHTNEFAWLPNTDLYPLDPEECKTVSEKGKSKTLIAAYHVAGEAHDLDHYRTLLQEHEKAVQEDQDAQDAREAAKAAKADKKKRKSEAADEDVDMDGSDEGAKSKKSNKKRKKEDESEGEGESDKPAKTPKTATKLKLTPPKAPTDKKAKETKAAKPKTTKRKSKAAEEEDAEVEEAKEPELTPEEAKARKEKEVLFLRHKLQKGFLARDQAPKETEMPAMASFFIKLERYVDLEASIIRSTKINKVLKTIVKLASIPRDAEFNFRQRSVDLLQSWYPTLNAEGGADAADEKDEKRDDKDEKTPAAATTNGIHKEGEAKDSPAAPSVEKEVEMTEAEGDKKVESEETAAAVPEVKATTPIPTAEAAEPAEKAPESPIAAQ